MENRKTGKVWLLGAGPSDPGLFTLKGRKVLENADVVVYDRLAGQGVLSMIPEGTEMIDVGKVSGYHPVVQEEINRILLEKAKQGLKVVRLKGGDPFVFGRGGEELELLVENKIPFEVVPGITSAVAVPAYCGIPVTHRDFTSSFHVITGHTKKSAEADIDYEALVRLNGTLIFLMGVAAMKKITDGLISAGMDKNMPAAVLEKGTSAGQRKIISTVENLCAEAKKAEIGTPAIIIVGKVCSLAEKFSWSEKRPLAGVRVAVTRPRERSSRLAEMIEEKGGEVLLMPAVKTEPVEDMSQLKESIGHIEDYDIIVFTSPFGVKVFFNFMKENEIDIRKIGNVKFAAIGSATAVAVKERGLMVDYVPKIYSGEELGKLLVEIYHKEEMKKKLLIPRAAAGTEQVIQPLKAAGISFDDVPVYDTFPEEWIGPAPDLENLDAVAFTSASSVRAFTERFKGICPANVVALCIGEQTRKEAEKHFSNISVSDKATVVSMVDALVKIFGEECHDNMHL